jgi:hypothetical protein
MMMLRCKNKLSKIGMWTEVDTNKHGAGLAIQ